MPKGLNWKNIYMYKSRKEIASTTSVLDQTIQILKSLNLPFEFDNDHPECIYVNYYDRKYFIDTAPDQRYITVGIHDIDSFSLDNESESLRLHQIIDVCNTVNFTKLCCINDNGTVGVDCIIDLLLMPELPDCDKYLICAFQTIVATIVSYFQMKEDGEPNPVRLTNIESYFYKTPSELQSTPSACDLLFSVLDSMKLKYHYDGKAITRVDYQGFEFAIIALKEFKFLNICFWGFDDIDQDDNSRLLKSYCIMDYINYVIRQRLVCSGPIEGTYSVNGVANILWIPEIPDLGRWLRNVFDDIIVSYGMYTELKENPNGLIEAMSTGYTSPSPYQA